MNWRLKRCGRRVFITGLVGYTLSACASNKALAISAALVGSATPKPSETATASVTATLSATPTTVLSATPRPTSTLAPTFEPSPTVQPTLTFVQQRDRRPKDEIEFLANNEILHGDKTRPVVMMTYDDGGRFEDVSRILDAYLHTDAKASFFVLGDWMAQKAADKTYRNASLVERIVKEGHLLGCHGFNHILFTHLNQTDTDRQIELFLNLVELIVPGYQVKYLRFPYGARDAVVRRIVAAWGLQSVVWNLESGGLDAKTAQRVIGGASNGAIVLSHLLRKYDIIQAVDIVRGLTASGFTLETVELGIAPEQRRNTAT